MKLILALSFAVIAVGCTKAETKSTPPVASVAPPVKLEGQAPTVVVAAVNKKVCVKGTEKHEFEIKKNGNGCILDSLESGKVSEEISGANGMMKCERKEKRLVAKLSRSGFQCL